MDYITKPFNPSIVLARVKTHLALYKQSRLLENLVDQRTEELQKHAMRPSCPTRQKAFSFFNMNHELRTPLNGIVGMSQLLMTTSPTEEQRELL